MAYLKNSKSAAVRAQLDHPVIDGDGHWLEPVPIFLDYLRQAAGASMVDSFVKQAKDTGWYDMSPEERLDIRLKRPTWWGEPANTLDRATAMIPRLFYERLDDFGIDFAIVYTSLGLFYVSNPHEDLRRATARAVNMMNAEVFGPYAHRLTPAAVVPMYTPDEAIAEATYAVRDLGMKAIMIANHVRRPIPAHARNIKASDASQVIHYIDSLGLESPYDYDTFWSTCVDLKVAVTAHSGSMGWESRGSVNNFTYNHIGHFANASHAFAKALVIGGVLHRFPQLRFGLLEGGIGWACNLLMDLIAHWEKRHGDAMRANVRPTNLDTQQLAALFTEYGGTTYANKIDDLMASLSTVNPFQSLADLTERETDIDDFAAAGVDSIDTLRAQFANQLYFGCEADDVTTAWAFDKHGNHCLKPIFSSDVGHFDVVDMSEVLEEAHELLEDGLMTEDDFRQFVFTNAASLHTSLSPDFFKGTVVEDAVAKHVLPAQATQMATNNGTTS
jgi:predicted TIM-barrel fold metal-dependent hydrolase